MSATMNAATAASPASNSRLTSVYPLAFPKGVKYQCELCQKPANKICDKCRVTYYCGPEHQQSDWYGIHEKICQSLVLLRTPQPFLPSEEERVKLDEEITTKKKQLTDYTRSVAQRYLFEGNYQRAIPGAMTSLKLSMDMHGIKSVELVPSYLILGEASQGLGNMIQAQEYLSQAEWTVLKNPDCPLPTVSKLHRNIAMLQMAQGDFESALRNLANDVYFSSEEFGTESVKVSGGYFLMGNIFFKQEKFGIADSLYRQVTNMWHEHLKGVISEKTQISELDTILGKVEEDEVDKEVIELASEAEARKILYSIYEIRKNESKPDENEIARVEVCLAMVHFLAKEYSRVLEILKSESLKDKNASMPELNKMVNFINFRKK